VLDQNFLYVILLSATALVSAVVAGAAWRRRNVENSARSMTLLLLASSWWGLTYALHWSASPRPTKFFWLDATYLGAVIVPTGFLLFALQFTARDHWLSRRTLALLAVEPLLTVVILWTDRWHGLFFGGQRLVNPNSIYQGGYWFWLNIFYTYTLITIALAIILDAFLRAPGVYRGQIGTILAGALLPLAGNLTGILGISPFPDLDVTPMLFSLMGVIFALGLFRFKLFDLVPVARSVLVPRCRCSVGKKRRPSASMSRRFLPPGCAWRRIIGKS